MSEAVSSLRRSVAHVKASFERTSGPIVCSRLLHFGFELFDEFKIPKDSMPWLSSWPNHMNASTKVASAQRSFSLACKSKDETPQSFIQHATEAGRLALAINELTPLPESDVSSNPFHCWVFVVYGILWQNDPAIPIYAPRIIPAEGREDLLWDRGFLTHCGDRLPDAMKPYLPKWTKTLPELYASRIHDMARASFWACEWIDRQLQKLTQSGHGTPVGESKSEGETPPANPFVPLTSWNEILAALNEAHEKPHWKNDAQTRDKIRGINEEYEGPIRMQKGKGKQPSVEKAALLTWWNGLREQYDRRTDEAKAEAESARLTVADSHNYGASGTVVPGIGGSEKRSRAKGEKGKERKR